MPYDKGPDLKGARIEDADFSNARLHAPDFSGVKITDGWFYGADISADVEGLVLNGVEVAPLIRAELEKREPQRVKLRAGDPAGLVEAWAMIEEIWKPTIAKARELPAGKAAERVDDEWSFVETHRHLILATDSWLRRMVKGMPRPYHPWGLAGGWLRDPSSWGLEPDATPSLDEVLDVRMERMNEVGEVIAAATPVELERVCVPPDQTGHPTSDHTVLQCLHVILNEEWEHHGYAVRDLAILEAAGA
ncbi:MAG TPA: DinB family protein [Acidimicrobiales bacterium]|nr:DinB family protein [Acidimicrobiales bacterium]